MPQTYYDSELSGEQIESALEAIHNVVTPSNNGKIMCIVNGAISAKSASEWGHGAVLEPLSVTANGDYTPPAGTDGFDEVHVAVPGATLTTKSITQNGTYNASQDNADGYSSVTVAVPGGATIESLEVTENGTYTPPSGVNGYAPVVVDVSSVPIVEFGQNQSPFIVQNSGQYIDVDADSFYLFSTIADGSYFNNATILTGDTVTSPVTTINGFGRVLCVIRTNSNKIKYNRTNWKDEYCKIDLPSGVQGGFVNAQWLHSTDPFSTEPGSLYLFISDNIGGEQIRGTFTGAEVISDCFCGQPGDTTHGLCYCALLFATANAISYSGGGTCHLASAPFIVTKAKYAMENG